MTNDPAAQLHAYKEREEYAPSPPVTRLSAGLSSAGPPADTGFRSRRKGVGRHAAQRGISSGAASTSKRASRVQFSRSNSVASPGCCRSRTAYGIAWQNSLPRSLAVALSSYDERRCAYMSNDTTDEMWRWQYCIRLIALTSTGIISRLLSAV